MARRASPERHGRPAPGRRWARAAPLIVTAVLAPTASALGQELPSAIPQKSADAARALAAWADARGRVVAFPAMLPERLAGIRAETAFWGGRASVNWFDFDRQIQGGPANISLGVTARAPRRALADCRGARHTIRTRILGNGVAVTSCRGSMSRFQAARGYGGWTYVASSKYYGGTTGADMVWLLLSLVPLPPPPPLGG
jgi:hypothetical protein